MKDVLHFFNDVVPFSPELDHLFLSKAHHVMQEPKATKKHKEVSNEHTEGHDQGLFGVVTFPQVLILQLFKFVNQSTDES